MKTDTLTPLEAEIRRRIESAGSLPVWQYMELCLSHPVHGYYTTRDPLGAGGDFVTSPEITQVFGELLGLWAASAWHRLPMRGSAPGLRDDHLQSRKLR